MKNNFDAIIIGGGLNGLTTAAYLARTGQRVLVLEQRQTLGGTAVTEELAPGVLSDTLVGNLTGFDPRIARELKLQGVEFIDADPSVHALQPDGAGVTLWRDANRTAEGLRPFSARDADKWGAFVERVARVSGFMEAIYAVTPPRPNEVKSESLWALGGLGLKLRGLGKTELYEALRMLPIPIADWMDEWFENETLKGILAAGGVTALMQGPLATGTTLNFLHREVYGGGAIRPTRYVRGGIGKLAEALANAIRAAGGEIRKGERAAQIRIQDDKATGVVLQNGEELTARRIASSADPHTTFLDLVGAYELDAEFVRAVRTVKYRGANVKLNFLLDGLPTFHNTDPSLLYGTIAVNPSIISLERAYDDAKYGSVSANPYLEFTIPTLADPSRAPEGKHVMSVWMQYAPYGPQTADDRAQTADGRQRTTDHRPQTADHRTQADATQAQVLGILSEYAPNLESLVLESQVLTPCDLQETYHLREGSLTQGAVMLDQFFFMRPVPGWAQYRTPIANLYLCGGGAHPGGGVAGAAGRNAAREMGKG